MKKFLLIIAIVAISSVIFTSCEDAPANYPSKCTVTFDSGHDDASGASGTIESQDFSFAKNANLSKNEFTRKYHSFIGWDSDNDGDVDYLDESNISLSKDVTLTALWRDRAPGDLGQAGLIFYDIDADNDLTAATAAKIVGADKLISELSFDKLSEDKQNLITAGSDYKIEDYKYLEVALEDCTVGSDANGKYEWGPNNDYDTKWQVGEGLDNTNLIKDLGITTGDGTNASKAAFDYSITKDGTPYDDWFLPSKNELIKVYENLHKNGLGNFENERYWTSTQHIISEDESYYVDFFDGIERFYYKNNDYNARAVRTF